MGGWIISSAPGGGGEGGGGEGGGFGAAVVWVAMETRLRGGGGASGTAASIVWVPMHTRARGASRPVPYADTSGSNTKDSIRHTSLNEVPK